MVGSEAEPAIETLVSRLEDNDWDVRAACAQALGAIGPAASAALEALLRSSADPDWFVRAEVAEALARIAPGHASVRPVLAKLLREPRVRKMAPTAKDALSGAAHRTGGDL
jgi:HEAT repeat protein